MFGYVQANIADLSEEEKQRYRAAYCGLCHTLGERHGVASRLSLSYDLTFLTLLLSSLYEPEERSGQCRCVVHPASKHGYMINSATKYAADMTVALMYHKCLDDWNDERSIPKKAYASLLEKQYAQVKQLWPEQCSAIESTIAELSAMEEQNLEDPDAAADCFGRLMEAVFVYRKDHWERHLRTLGYGLGRYIYLADAAVDLKRDREKGSYNPLKNLSTPPQELRPILQTTLGEASRAFEILPLVQDIHLLRNILYSGLWIKYNQGMEKEKKVKT